MLTIRTREKGEVVLADLSGRLTMGAGEKALHELVEGLLKGGRRQIALNLKNLEFLDSSGLGALVHVYRECRAVGARLKVLSAGGRVYDTLSLARLLPLFEVYEDEGELISSYGAAIEAAEPEVLYKVSGAVATVTLNRPRRFNALTRRLLSQLVSVLARAREDPAVRAMVLTGAGRAFCFGADAEELREGEGALPTLELFQTVIRDIQELPKPVVGAINGFATGAGLDLALSCDLRVLARKARMSSAFIRFGLVPDGGSTHALPRLVGPARAAELVLSGRAVEPEEALAWGLVNRLAEPGETLRLAGEWAAELAAGPPLALARAKRLLRTGPLGDLASALAKEAHEQAQCFGGAEFREGLHAHLEKRDPVF